MDERLFVLSGGPGAGKTTLLRELEQRGFRCVPEVARQIIQEQASTGGRALPWDDRAAYARLMLERSIESFLEHANGTEVTFFDRGIPDTLCYAQLIGLGDETAIRAACERYRYATRVFLAPPWREIYQLDSERRQDFDEAVRTYRPMSQVYSECGYEPIELPLLSPRERADLVTRFILPA